jgi:hypothetical protein
MHNQLTINKTSKAQVSEQGGIWRLEVPAGEAGTYRLAQLDDYAGKPRRSYPRQAPFRLRAEARASSNRLPGTWGLGLWNNPFGMAILTGTELLRLPALPNTAWFFFASPENHLALRDHLPANGGLAGVFRSPRLPALLLALGAPALPFLLLPPAARLLRRLARLLVKEDSRQLTHPTQDWHTYELIWLEKGVTFKVDGQIVHEARQAPLGPLGTVLWVDNQYAALRPDGRVGFGTLPNPEPAWIEISGLEMESLL